MILFLLINCYVLLIQQNTPTRVSCISFSFVFSLRCTVFTANQDEMKQKKWNNNASRKAQCLTFMTSCLKWKLHGSFAYYNAVVLFIKLVSIYICISNMNEKQKQKQRQNETKKSKKSIWYGLFIQTIICHNANLVVTGGIISGQQSMVPLVTTLWDHTLQWRHNELDCVSNHQPHDCLLNRLFRRRSKKTSKLSVTGLCAGKMRKMLPFDDVTMNNCSFQCSISHPFSELHHKCDTEIPTNLIFCIQ